MGTSGSSPSSCCSGRTLRGAGGVSGPGSTGSGTGSGWGSGSGSGSGSGTRLGLGSGSGRTGSGSGSGRARGRPARARCRDPAGRARARARAAGAGGGDRRAITSATGRPRARRGRRGRGVGRRRGLEDRGRDVRDRGVVQGDGRCLHGGGSGDPAPRRARRPGNAAGRDGRACPSPAPPWAPTSCAPSAGSPARSRPARAVQLRDVAVGTAPGSTGRAAVAEPGCRAAPKVEGGATGRARRAGRRWWPRGARPARPRRRPGPRTAAALGRAAIGTRRGAGAVVVVGRLVVVGEPAPEQVVGAVARLHRVVAHGPKVRRRTPACSGNGLVQRGLGVGGLTLLAIEVAQEVRVVVGSERARVAAGAPARRPFGRPAMPRRSMIRIRP